MWIRPALAAEAADLTRLVVRSKAHWGYDEAVLAASRDALAVAADDVVHRRIVLAEDARGVLGVASLEGTAPAGELGLLFVDPPAIGCGVGAALYRHVLATGRAAGFTRLRIEADPHAVQFYRAMGARPSGTDPRSELLRLEVDLPAPEGWVHAWTGGRRSVHIGNVAEFQAQFAPASAHAAAAGSHYACLAAFASPHPAALVLPRAVPPGWIALLERRLGWDPVEVIDGLDDEAGPSAAVLDRPALAAHLRGLGLPLVAWGRTAAFAELAGEPWRPQALRYESKRAANELFHQLAVGDPAIVVPEQWPAASRWAARRRLRVRSRAGLVTVVKTEHGAGGSGTWVVDGRREPGPPLPAGPVLLEEFVAGGGPFRDLTYDGFVGGDGEPYDVGVALMDVRDAAYAGATIGPGLLPEVSTATATAFGNAVGRALAGSGYRGWFDVDFVTATDGRLAPTEINLRLTGPSAAFMVKARLDEVRGGDHLVRTIDLVPLGARLPDWALSDLVAGLGKRCAEIGAVLLPAIPTAAFEPAPWIGVVLAAHDREGLDAAERLVRAAAADLRETFSAPGVAAGSRGPRPPLRRSSAAR